jgi:hypothetical protein
MERDPDPQARREQSDELNDLTDAALPPAELDQAEQRELWEQFQLQQRRRSCPGCGDDGAIF